MDINEIFFIGSNRYGQAGTGEKTHNQTYQYPKPYCFPVFIQQISCGSHHSALLTIDGNVYTMGSNIHGTLGTSQSNLNYSFNPVFVQNLSQITKIVSGAFHIAAINSEGQLFMWGKGTDGQLGNSFYKNSFKPTYLSVFQDEIEDVSCGLNHTLVLCMNKVYSFGNGIFGQLGIGSNRNYNTPMKVSNFDDLKVEAISAGDNHSLFLVNGQVYGCGDNSFGQLGVQVQKKYILQPTKIPNLNNVSVIQAAKFSSVLTLDGKLLIWGGKFRQTEPTQIKQSLENFVDIRAGGDKLYALTCKGDLYLFDLNCDTFQGIKISKIQIEKHSFCQSSSILDFDIGQNHSLILGGIIGQIDAKYATQNRFLKVIIEDKSQIAKNIISNSNYQSCDIGRSMLAKKKYFSKVKEESNQQSMQNHYNQLLHKNGIKAYVSNTSQQCSLQPSLPKKQLKFHQINALTMQQHNQNFEQYVSNSSQRQNQISVEHLAKQPSSIVRSASNITKKQTKTEDPIMSRFMLFENKSRKNSINSSQNRNDNESNQSTLQSKLDRIIQLLQQSSQLNKSEYKNINEKIKYDLNNKENIGNQEHKETKIKGNKQLIMNLRQKQLRISEMQQLLSRKQLQLQAQRQTIHVLKIMLEQKGADSQLI